MSQAQRVIKTFGETRTGAETTEIRTCKVADSTAKILVLRFAAKRSSGTGANWQPRLANVAAFTNDDFSEKITEDSAAVTTRINKTYANGGVPVRTDSEGKVYFKPCFDAGSDNAYQYEFEYEVVLDG